MRKLKNLNIEKIEKLFNDHFTVDKNELTKGITCWSLTPRRDTENDTKGLQNELPKN